MAKSAAITALPRDGKGKGPARAARREGRIPGVLYGHGKASVPLSVDAHTFDRLLHEVSVESTLIDLEVQGQGPLKVLVREVQRHPYRNQILHVDFFHISMEEKITLAVPVTLVGTPLGVRLHGGILDHSMRELEIECLPQDIPEKVEIDVGNLDIGDAVRIADVSLPNVQLLADPEQTIVTVVPPTVIEEVVAEAAEAEGAEPEVIARGKEEEEGESTAGKAEKGAAGKAEKGAAGKAEKGATGKGEKK